MKDGSRPLLKVAAAGSGLAEAAARRGAHCPPALTLSTEQLHWERTAVSRQPASRFAMRPAPAGLSRPGGRGSGYDAIVSVEMFEAVGRSPTGRATSRRWPHAWRRAAGLCAADHRDPRRSVRAATCVLTPTSSSNRVSRRHARIAGAIRRRRARTAGLDARRACTRSAATTRKRCKRWLAAFDAKHRRRSARTDSDEQFIRCWRFYLAYCAAGFASETTDVAQYTLVPA